MPLDITPGGASSDSYASIETIHAYAEKHGASFPITGDDGPATAAAIAAAEAAARRATAAIDGIYGPRFIGEPASPQQALEWPRTDAWFRDEELPDNTIPRQVVNAVCEAAIRELAKPGSLAPDVTLTGQTSRKKVKAGPVETETQFAEARSASDALPVIVTIDRLLAGLLAPAAGGSVDLLRV